MKHFLSSLLATLATFMTLCAAEPKLPPQPSPPAVYSLVLTNLSAARERLAKNDPALAPALAQLRSDADKLLKHKLWSVMDKTRTPPSGDQHDYLSLAPYFWPNPKTADGLPYVRHDGEINPESKTGTDANAFGAMGEAVQTLGLAYYFTGHEPYAEKAAAIVRTWFLDPATRMNPHLKYAQAIRGVNEGRGTGILDSRHLVEATDGLALLTGSAAWTETDQQALRAWLDAYYRWVTESSNGREERAAKNNHGSWYDAQVLHLALVLGRTDDARKIAGKARLRIAAQIEPDGHQPEEMTRTKSFDYCCFNLEALLQLARASQHADVDLWSFTAPDGRSLKQAVLFMAPYADPQKPWLKKDLKLDPRSRLLPLIAESLNHFEDSSLRAALTHFADSSTHSARWHLISNSP